MSIWNHLPVMALAAGPKRAREAIEEKVDELFRRYREQMQLKAKPGAYPYPPKPIEVRGPFDFPW